MITGLAIGAIVGTICGYTLCALMVIGKESDIITSNTALEDCKPSNCNKSCTGWNRCDIKWSNRHDS